MEIISPRLASENGFKPPAHETPRAEKKEVASHIKLHTTIAHVIESLRPTSLQRATRHAASHMRYNLRIAGDRSRRALPPGTIEVNGTQYDGHKYSLSLVAANDHAQKKIMVFISEDNGDKLLMDQYEVDQVATTNGSTRLVVDAAPIAVADLQSVIHEVLGGSTVEIFVTNVTPVGKTEAPLMLTENGY